MFAALSDEMSWGRRLPLGCAPGDESAWPTFPPLKLSLAPGAPVTGSSAPRDSPRKSPPCHLEALGWGVCAGGVCVEGGGRN